MGHKESNQANQPASVFFLINTLHITVSKPNGFIMLNLMKNIYMETF